MSRFFIYNILFYSGEAKKQYTMAREWETTREEQYDDRAVSLGLYRRHNRRLEALEERKFRPELLREEDLRSGDTRRFMLDDGYGDLDAILLQKNSFEGLID